jgi:hypothetical protein
MSRAGRAQFYSTHRLGGLGLKAVDWSTSRLNFSKLDSCTKPNVFLLNFQDPQIMKQINFGPQAFKVQMDRYFGFIVNKKITQIVKLNY